MSLTKFWTIEGFESLTKQQLFDMSAAHILKTRQKSKKGTLCQYAGTGCAAAPFLKEEFRGVADSAGACGTVWNCLAEASHVPFHEVQFVVTLQSCHDAARDDTGDFMADWKAFMTNLAVRENLSNHLIEADETNERA